MSLMPSSIWAPKGEQGDPGPQGPPGVQGPPGPTGSIVIAPHFISLRDYATGIVDGVASNQTAIQAAINAAIAANNSTLLWPAGDYVSTANLTGLHSVRHIGPGRIKRGSTFFYPQPSDFQTNNLYVAATGGSALNDGLTSDLPLDTFQTAATITRNYGPVLQGIWQINLLAGTYNFSAGSQSLTTPSKNRVRIWGPLAGHPNVPTVFIDGGGVQAQYLHGINCDGEGVNVHVRDIKFQNFTESSGNTRIGLVAANGANIFTENVHSFRCSWTGIYAKETEQVRVSGGILDCDNIGAYGFISDSSHTSFGYNAGDINGGPIVRKALSAGVYWSTGSQGHCDFVTFEDNAVAFFAAENSRCDTVGNNYKRNTVAKRMATGAWAASGGAAEQFNNGTADANITNLQYLAYSGDIAEGGNSQSASELRVAFDRTARTLTGVTPTVLATPYTLPAYRLQGVGKECRVKCWGIFTQVTAGAVLNAVFGGMTVAITVPAAGTNIAFQLEVILLEVAGGYRAFGTLSQGLNAVRHASNAAGFVSTAAQAISISATLANAADSMAIYRTDVYISG